MIYAAITAQIAQSSAKALRGPPIILIIEKPIGKGRGSVVLWFRLDTVVRHVRGHSKWICDHSFFHYKTTSGMDNIYNETYERCQLKRILDGIIWVQ